MVDGLALSFEDSRLHYAPPASAFPPVTGMRQSVLLAVATPLYGG